MKEKGEEHLSDADPCAACPWRTSNAGKPHPDGWYRRANLARLWRLLREGEPMSCHPTDPDNPVSEEAQAAGYRPAPPGSTRLECRGAVILVQREFHLLINRFGNDVAAYRSARPRALTKRGIGNIAVRLVLGGVPLVGGPKMARPDLNADVGYEPFLPWTPIASDGDPGTQP